MKIGKRSKFIAVILMLMLIAACSVKHQEAKNSYTCPMHPEIIRDKPGHCPICGMTLVRKKPMNSPAPSSLLKDYRSPANTQRTVVASRRKMKVHMVTDGIIVVDTRRSVAISARFGGRIEKLYWRTDLQAVHRGEKIMEVYSPELRSAQADLLFLLRSDKQNDALIAQATERLTQLGLSDEQLNELIRSKKIPAAVAVNSAADGYISRSGEPNTNIKEGDYLQPGQVLFKLSDTRSVWAEFYVGPGTVRLQEDVIIRTPGPSDETKVQIGFVERVFQGDQTLTKVKAYLDNAENKFRPGERVTGSFETILENGIWISRSSVLDLGTRQMVYVRRNGVFEPKVITAGLQSDGWINVVSGLHPGDSIALESHFMSDHDALITSDVRAVN